MFLLKPQELYFYRKSTETATPAIGSLFYFILFYFWFVSETSTKFRKAEINEDGRIVKNGS